MADPADPRLKTIDTVAWILMGGGILFILGFHLVPGLVAGLLVHVLLQKMTGLLHGPRLSKGTAKFLSVLLLGALAGGLSATVVLLLLAFIRGHVGNLPDLIQRVMDALEHIRPRLESWGVPRSLTETLPDRLEAVFSDWLEPHAAKLTQAGGRIGRFIVHAGIGIVVGLLAFFRHGPATSGPLAQSLLERVRRLAEAFETVVFAQVEISALNTGLTSIYLFMVLPILGAYLPLSGTLVAVAFVAGMLPVIGNLISNTAIVIISLGVSPWIAILSLLFLVTIHKLEYFLNAKIIGGRIGAATWETLLSLVGFEAAFGIPGLVIAPIVYAYVKRELRDRNLV